MLFVKPTYYTQVVDAAVAAAAAALPTWRGKGGTVLSNNGIYELQNRGISSFVLCELWHRIHS